MKRMVSMLAAVVLSAGLAACGAQGNAPPPVVPETWPGVLEAARGQTVTLYMWGGSPSVNAYVDDYAAPALEARYGVFLERVPLSDIRDVVNRLVEEKAAGKPSGKVDLLWINGENFKYAKDRGILWPVPDAWPPAYEKGVDAEDPSLAFDFGEPVEGYERPWGRSRLVFIHDAARTGAPPFESAETLMAWAEAHPERFTYPAPPDFTGSAFLRLILSELKGYGPWTENGSEAFAEASDRTMGFLQALKPHLWKSGATYPESSGKLDQLFAAGEVDLTLSYNPSHAVNMIEAGLFPETVRSFILEKGTLSNTHYLAIAESSRNKAGALAVVDLLLSEEAQIEKLDPARWGDGTVLSLEAVSEEGRKAMEALNGAPWTVPVETLDAKSFPEMPGVMVDRLERRWYEDVAKQ